MDSGLDSLRRLLTTDFHWLSHDSRSYMCSFDFKLDFGRNALLISAHIFEGFLIETSQWLLFFGEPTSASHLESTRHYGGAIVKGCEIRDLFTFPGERSNISSERTGELS